MKGPGLFVAQFIGAQAPFNTLSAWPVGQAAWVTGHYNSRHISIIYSTWHRQPPARITVMRCGAHWQNMAW